MGSTLSEMERALTMCRQETYAALCGESARFWYPSPIIRAEGHPHEVVVSPFDIDRTEVTVAAYKRCVAAGACAPPCFPGGDARYDRPDFPVTHVRWDDAVDYCRWVGGRLPTEAEWELAAKGPAGFDFPWGDLYNKHLANHGALADDPTDGSDGFVGLAPVGSYPDGVTGSGLVDMAGNAAEWVHDFYDRDEEGYGYARAKQVDPRGLAFSPFGHVIRGGSYRDAAFMLRTSARRASTFATREIGFRCVYPMGPAAAASTSRP
jgi:formylglycine-generating enzyme required for sulfatase activity